MSKIPQLTLAFWVMKIAATTLGETAGDLFSMTLHIGYAVTSVILLVLFLVILTAQLRARRFHPFLYWGVILATSTVGTTMSDFMDRTLGLGYTRGAAMLLVLLLVVLAVWRWSTGTLAVTDVQSRKAEAFYWAAILVSNTLGTALGDFLANSSGLGFKGGALLISAALTLVVLAHYFTAISGVLLFWIAFVLTRPFGATFGDLLTKMPEKGGLGFGTIGSSLVLLSILVTLVFWTRRHHLDIAPKAAVAVSPIISFRPLIPADFSQLHDWLGRPHVAEWWSPTPSPAEVEAEFGPLTADHSTTRAYVALGDGRPIGYIQSYVALGSGDGWWPDERDPGVRGIDQFLVNAEDLGRGLGSAMIRAFVERLFADPAVTRIQTDPSPSNRRAIRCYEKVGFRAAREVDTPDGPALLMIRDRT
jgi:uncharacterized membrane-anchored protein/RimJ/RimL family protein N-acetyltransferase